MNDDGHSGMHERQRPLESWLEEIWLAALEDAKVEPTKAILVTFPGIHSSEERISATTWKTGRIDVSRDAEVNEILEHLNSSECARAIRIGVWIGRSEEGVSALIRHELEHARQFSMIRRLADLHSVAKDIVRFTADSGALYQRIPMEEQANSAASTFVRFRFGGQRIDELVAEEDDDVALFRPSCEVVEIDELPEAMIQFLAANDDLCEQWATDAEVNFRRRLNSAWPRAGDAWERVVKGEAIGKWR